MAIEPEEVALDSSKGRRRVFGSGFRLVTDPCLIQLEKSGACLRPEAYNRIWVDMKALAVNRAGSPDKGNISTKQHGNNTFMRKIPHSPNGNEAQA